MWWCVCGGVYVVVYMLYVSCRIHAARAHHTRSYLQHACKSRACMQHACTVHATYTQHTCNIHTGRMHEYSAYMLHRLSTTLTATRTLLPVLACLRAVHANVCSICLVHISTHQTASLSSGTCLHACPHVPACHSARLFDAHPYILA